jgi:predicted AlkP superfamily pyrophosphatase or phosphodiesterase
MPNRQSNPAFFPLRCLAALLVLCTTVSAQVLDGHNGPNSAAQQSKHYVILVSLDGFRYDYARKYNATNLLAMAAAGATAPDGMLPCYPSVTFPNHYSIVTGLYPEHHGIVANRFYDPARNQTYSYTDQATSSDGSWYSGVPLWVLAEQQHMRSASFFWPSSNARIGNTLPSYYLEFKDGVSSQARVDQAIAWLSLLPEQRPHFILLYFPQVDHAGHQFGPDSPEVADAVADVDSAVGHLLAGVHRLNLPVDVIVVSDHGMVALQGNPIKLDALAGPAEHLITKEVGSLLYTANPADAQSLANALSGKSTAFRVYRSDAVPPQLHYSSNPRIGDPVIVATGPFRITEMTALKGAHGYDPRLVPEMKASFFAEGPDIAHVQIPTFENIDVYPLIAKILDLKITTSIDGSLDPVAPALAAPAPASPPRRHAKSLQSAPQKE